MTAALHEEAPAKVNLCLFLGPRRASDGRHELVTVFHPVPNVDSVLVVLERRGPAPPPELRALVQAAFAHRRKALPRSLALAPAVFGDGVRDRAREALVALGHPADVRAERLLPADFRALWEALR